MIALEVLVNGQPYRTMGFGDFGMVTTEVNWFRIQSKVGHIFETLEVGGRGLEGADGGTHLQWAGHKLKVGDEVTVRVVETNRFDEPDERPSRRDPAKSA